MWDNIFTIKLLGVGMQPRKASEVLNLVKSLQLEGEFIESYEDGTELRSYQLPDEPIPRKVRALPAFHFYSKEMKE